MPTKMIYLQGKAKWVQVHQPDKFNKYGLVFYPDEKSLETLRDLQAEGLLNRMKKDDDGYFMRIGSPASKEIKGKVRGFAPPELIGPDGLPLREVAVGNGSDVTLKVEQYQYPTPTGGTGIAIRLKAIRVDNLIPFERSSFSEEAAKQVDGLAERPTQEEKPF